jgi:hypothetical protein
MTDKIEITKEEYVSLLKDAEILLRLESGGVDNWTWYGESIYGEDQQDLDEWEEETRKRVFGN